MKCEKQFTSPFPYRPNWPLVKVEMKNSFIHEIHYFPSITSRRSISPSFCDVNTPPGRQKKHFISEMELVHAQKRRKMFCNRHDLYQLEITSKIMTRVPCWEPFRLFLCFSLLHQLRLGVNDLFQDLHARDGSGKKSMQSPPFLPTGAKANKLALHTHFMRNCAINRKTLMHHN